MTMHWRMLSADQKVEAIKAVYVPGYSARDIASQLSKMSGDSISRHAVIGVYTRRIADLLAHPLTTPPKEKRRQTRTEVSSARPSMRLVKASRPAYRRVKMTCAEVEPPLNISLMDLERHHCRWPVTDDGPHLFCGRDKAEGSSYCAGHARLSVGRGTEGERSADRTLLAAA